MKKIVALVLALVMVLGLATTAFAAPDTYDFYLADNGMNTMLALEKPSYTGYTVTEVPAHTNGDGSGNVAYLVFSKGGSDYYYVKTTTPYTTSYAITEAGKTDILYYVNKAEVQDAKAFEYSAAVTAFDKFSTFDKCGYVTKTEAPKATDVYFQTAAGVVYKAEAKVGTVVKNNYLLDGEIVTAPVTAEKVVDHEFVANGYVYDTTLKVNVPTSALCTKCLMTSTTIYKDGKVPAATKFYELYEGNKATDYSVVAVAAVSAPVVDGEKVESAETFDAGIAMYVGMSVMAAAGSAVVLKKKD